MRKTYWEKRPERLAPGALLNNGWICNVGHFLLLDAYIKLCKMGYLKHPKLYIVLNNKSTIGNTYMLEQFKELVTFVSEEEQAELFSDEFDIHMLTDFYFLKYPQSFKKAFTQWQTPLPTRNKVGSHMIEISEFAYEEAQTYFPRWTCSEGIEHH